MIEIALIGFLVVFLIFTLLITFDSSLLTDDEERSLREWHNFRSSLSNKGESK